MAEAITKTREQLTAEFSDLDDRYAAIVQAHAPEQLTRRPGANAWSAAECMEHVALTNSQYLAAIKSAIVNTRESSAPQEPLTTAGWFSAFFVKSIGPKAKVKIRARKKIRPSAT